jgi:hypothetical protein
MAHSSLFDFSIKSRWVCCQLSLIRISPTSLEVEYFIHRGGHVDKLVQFDQKQFTISEKQVTVEQLQKRKEST